MTSVWDKEGEASLGEQRSRPTKEKTCGTRSGFHQIAVRISEFRKSCHCPKKKDIKGTNGKIARHHCKGIQPQPRQYIPYGSDKMKAGGQRANYPASLLQKGGESEIIEPRAHVKMVPEVQRPSQ